MNLLQVGLFTTLVASAPVFATTLEFQGKATGENGQELYTEHHQSTGECTGGLFRPGEHQVDYRKPGNDDVFASKRLMFPDSALRPAVTFTQPDFDEKLTIEYPGENRAAIKWRDLSGSQKDYSVTFDQRLVVDSGFDHLIRAEWDKLRDGQQIKFRFLGPTRGEHYGFVAEAVTNTDITADLVVKLRPTGIFLSMLVDPIVLGYNSRGALTDYQGMTNIRKDEDTNHTAHIRYQVTRYPDCPLVP